MNTYEVTICNDEGVPDWEKARHIESWGLSVESACIRYAHITNLSRERDVGLLAVRGHGTFTFRTSSNTTLPIVTTIL